MEGAWSHADSRRWPTPRIHERFMELQAQLERPLSMDRKRQINHEMSCVAWEGLMREQESRKRDEEIAWAEYTFNRGSYDRDISPTVD